MVSRDCKQALIGFTISFLIGLGMIAMLQDLSPLFHAGSWRELYDAPGIPMPADGIRR